MVIYRGDIIKFYFVWKGCFYWFKVVEMGFRGMVGGKVNLVCG